VEVLAARSSWAGCGSCSAAATGCGCRTARTWTARLAFLVVGPMVDLKLFAMQAGIFGRRFAVRFAPATFALAVVVSVAVGTVLL